MITYPAVIKDSFSTQGYSSLVLVTKCLQERENLEANGTFQQANITKPQKPSKYTLLSLQCAVLNYSSSN